jgi:hypothetical protein
MKGKIVNMGRWGSINALLASKRSQEWLTIIGKERREDFVQNSSNFP